MHVPGNAFTICGIRALWHKLFAGEPGGQPDVPAIRERVATRFKRA